MPLEQLILFFGAFVVMAMLAVFSRNKLLMSKESKNIFTSACEVFSESIVEASRNSREIIGKFQGYKVSIALIPQRYYPDIINITIYGKFPKQQVFMLEYPDLGSGIVWNKNRLIYRIENIYNYQASHLADKILNQLKLMAIKAQELERNEA